MTEYRYHRLAPNNNAWLRPHLGRFTGNSEGDYVAQHGFGLEDWNFAKDIWQDGKIHLYLRQPPAESARDQVFSIVLGDYRDGQHFISGFAEQVRYQTSTLSAETLDRRASELMGLQERDQLGGKFSEMSKDELIKALGDEANSYWAALRPEHLLVPNEPVPLPVGLCEITSWRYSLLRLQPEDYEAIKNYAMGSSMAGDDADERNDGFNEGTRRMRKHFAKERSHTLIRKAKAEFIRKNGRLFCEACGIDPSIHYKEESLRGKIIEAHHDVPLSTYDKPSQTKISDLSMLCPSCHRVIHATQETVAQLKARLG